MAVQVESASLKTGMPPRHCRIRASAPHLLGRSLGVRIHSEAAPTDGSARLAETIGASSEPLPLEDCLALVAHPRPRVGVGRCFFHVVEASPASRAGVTNECRSECGEIFVDPGSGQVVSRCGWRRLERTTGFEPATLTLAR